MRNLIAATGRDPKRVLTTVPGGYLLDTAGGSVDVVEFERLAAAGHRALESDEPALASSLFADALDLWRGPALVDVAVGALLGVEARRLDEVRLGVQERRIEADLRLGRHHMLISELSALVARNSRHEGLHAQYMIALYRSGRQGEALAAYQRLRAGQVRDLGLEPSPALRSLQRSILMSDPALGAPVPAYSQAV
ncbi:AfsR/SARP family transcriptional regulator [Actinokineospora soli]|uniref:AfsR/SARP family transcriptional regulator n=1 Tax=Actinokineospora soli TaxID=1048753 RepID=A0ABW2TXB2_9PSEU